MEEVNEAEFSGGVPEKGGKPFTFQPDSGMQEQGDGYAVIPQNLFD